MMDWARLIVRLEMIEVAQQRQNEQAEKEQESLELKN
jgi:hypothetical protein